MKAMIVTMCDPRTCAFCRGTHWETKQYCAHPIWGPKYKVINKVKSFPKACPLDDVEELMR